MYTFKPIKARINTRGIVKVALITSGPANFFASLVTAARSAAAVPAGIFSAGTYCCKDEFLKNFQDYVAFAAPYSSSFCTHNYPMTVCGNFLFFDRIDGDQVEVK